MKTETKFTEVNNGRIWMNKDVPTKPVILSAVSDTFAMCPNCGRHLVINYNKAKDRWEYDERCYVCGQAILDEQKDLS